jgi:glycosyltransferase involved in cell wall biosynthesis
MLIAQHPELAPKVKLLHNWVDIDHHSSSKAVVDFKKKWGITQQYIAVFAGVMGPSQYLDLILDIATQMQDELDLLFLMVGDGKEKPRLQKLAADRGLNNVRFEGFISREVYPDLLSACSIGLVCLSPQNKTPVVPGKILGHMASGLPVAAFLHTASDAHDLIAAAECGVSENSGDIEACVRAMRNLLAQSSAFSNIGLAGKKYATTHFSKEVCVSELIELLHS